MIRATVPAVLLFLAATSTGAQPATSCDLRADSSSCTRVLACIGDDGRWFNGRSFGRGQGTVAGTFDDGVACTGTWVSRNAIGLGQADVTCEDGMSVTVLYTYQDEFSGTALGSGVASNGERIRVWSGNNVLAYLRAETGTRIATLPCGGDGIPLS